VWPSLHQLACSSACMCSSVTWFCALQLLYGMPSVVAGSTLVRDGVCALKFVSCFARLVCLQVHEFMHGALFMNGTPGLFVMVVKPERAPSTLALFPARRHARADQRERTHSGGGSVRTGFVSLAVEAAGEPAPQSASFVRSQGRVVRRLIFKLIASAVGSVLRLCAGARHERGPRLRHRSARCALVAARTPSRPGANDSIRFCCARRRC
jgi:hypothetical protein